MAKSNREREKVRKKSSLQDSLYLPGLNKKIAFGQPPSETRRKKMKEKPI